MTASAQPDGEAERALGHSLAHIRNATETLLAAQEQATETLLLGIGCLDLQSMFGEVWSAWIPNARSASESLACAQAELEAHADHVPLAIWSALQFLRERVDDGHR